MEPHFNGKKILFAAMLFAGSTVTALNAAAADGAAAYDFTVVSVPKDATHPHQHDGSSIVFLVNGVQGRTLVLTRGKTYTFNVDTGVQHDFYITTDPAGWGTGTLAEGVTGNFTYKGIVTFKPTAATPDTLYYQCRNHRYMGGQIHIVNPGEESKIKVAEHAAAPATKPAAAPAMDIKPAATIDKVELRQKVDFADMTIHKSEAAKRIAASNNAEAKAKVKDAQDKFAAGLSAFNAGDLVLARTKIDESTKLMAEAARLVPSEFMLSKAKAKYGELLHGIQGLEESFAQSYATISKEPGAKHLQPLDKARIQKSLDAAKALYAEGKYDKANDILSGTQDEITAALNKMLANRTVSYEMKFDNPEQEFVHELARYHHFEELIPLAIEQKQPTRELLAQMDAYVNRGKAKRDQAVSEARRKSFAAAVETIKDASDEIESGLKLIGVR